MHVGFSFELLTIDLWNIDLLDTHLDLLDTDILSKYFFCLHNVFKTSSRHVFKAYLQEVPKRCLQDVFKMSSVQQFFFFKDAFKTSWKTWNCYTEGVLKTSSRNLLDVFKTSSRPANVLLGSSHFSHDVVFFFLQISEVCSLKSIY